MTYVIFLHFFYNLVCNFISTNIPLYSSNFKILLGIGIFTFLGLGYFNKNNIDFEISKKNDKVLVYQMEKAFLFYSLCGKTIYILLILFHLDGREKALKMAFMHITDRGYKNYLTMLYHIQLSENSISLSPFDFLQKAKEDGLRFEAKELNELNFTKLMKFEVNFGDTKCYPIKQ